MRKLILGGIVFVIALVAWKLYLDYDTKQFIQSLPKPPVPTQSLDTTPERATTTPINTETDVPPVEVLEDAPDTSATTPAELTGISTTDATFEDVFVEQAPEPDDTGFSPELEALFSAYYPLHQKLGEVSKVLNPILDRHHFGSNRIREILFDELSASADGPERQALYAEIDEIHAWKESVKQETFELQDERQQLSNERSTLLAEYGILSWREFHEIHGDTYNTWKAEQ